MFGRSKNPCAPQEVQKRLLKEIYEEAMQHLNTVEAPIHYSWVLFRYMKEIRLHVSLEVSRRLHRGDLKAKIETAGYRLCNGS